MEISPAILNPTVFFSWQSDLPEAHYKQPIWQAIEHACDSVVIAEMAPRADHSTLGAAGSPKIMETIYDNIDQCSVFVADVSFVAETNKGKKTPNPNVMLELGYAARSVGWERIILVLNEVSGHPDHLPFDLKQHRWPVICKITESSESVQKKIARLAESLSDYIGIALGNRIRRVEENSAKLDSVALRIMAQYGDQKSFIIPDPPATMGQTLVASVNLAAMRLLLDLGALKYSPDVASYFWTTDGRLMISHNIKYIEILRQNGFGPTG